MTLTVVELDDDAHNQALGRAVAAELKLRGAKHKDVAQAMLHQLRHSFVSKCYAVNRDLVVTQELAGHENITTTRGYTWTDPSAAAATVNCLCAP